MSNITVDIVRHNKNRLKLKSDKKQLLEFVRKQFTCRNPNFRHIPYGTPHVSCISPTFTFRSGMTLDIIKVIKAFDPTIKINICGVGKEVLPFSYKVEIDNLVQPENTTYSYRTYQADAIVKGLRAGRGTFELATSAGKSLIIYGLMKNIWANSGTNNRCLLLVPNIQLVEQMYADMIDYGCPAEKVSRFSSKYRDCEDSDIIISNRSWLERHADELPDIDVVIVDECHQLSPTSKVGKYVSNFDTQKRFGFTGTLPGFLENLWFINGVLGKTLTVVKPHELQASGHIADTKIVSVRFEHPYKAPESKAETALQRAKERYPLEWRFIESCEFSNQFMCKLMGNFKGNTILLYDHIDHGDYLLEACKTLNLDKRVFLINGTTNVDYREMVRAKMEEDNNIMLVGNTKCVGTGLSIKNVHNIGFAFSSGKSTSKVLQAIGRGLRLNGKFDKSHMKLIDFHHNFRYSLEHFGVRLKMYEENYELDKIIRKVIPVKPILNPIFDL